MVYIGSLTKPEVVSSYSAVYVYALRCLQFFHHGNKSFHRPQMTYARAV